ncbi:MAG: ORF6N domain-containing protein [Arcobacteraceae bacterium]|nr:ORF6N domain-containing protein [Arcobacteraceae bacterium]
MEDTIEHIEKNQDIQSKIYTIRGLQVMLDRDLAKLYEVETKVFKQAVNRNIDRFPQDFMFELTKEELENWRSQFVTSSSDKMGLRRAPYAFTEQDEKFAKVFEAIEQKEIKPSFGIFYDGQMFDAYIFISDLIRGAKSKIVLIDNYIDDSVLTFFSKNQDVDVTIYTHTVSKQLKLDIEKYNSQYKAITIKSFKDSHDRFMIIDDNEVYHIGASLKDLGKKWFAFFKIGIEPLDILDKLK